MSDIVLSQFRGTASRDGAAEDAPRRRRVFVDREGRIVVGDDTAEGGERRHLSEVHPAVFAARP